MNNNHAAFTCTCICHVKSLVMLYTLNSVVKEQKRRFSLNSRDIFISTSTRALNTLPKPVKGGWFATFAGKIRLPWQIPSISMQRPRHVFGMR